MRFIEEVPNCVRSDYERGQDNSKLMFLLWQIDVEVHIVPILPSLIFKLF